MNPADYYDLVLAAICVWREFRGEPFGTKLAGAFVIRNRVRSGGRWPARASLVVLQKHQFSSFSPGDPNAVKFPDPEDQAWLDCCQAVAMSLDPTTPDPTGGANHYHSVPEGQPPPSWAEGKKPTLDTGSTKFYRL
jgi:spore germination cell wall hydrolase CwlJ-like protein